MAELSGARMVVLVLGSDRRASMGDELRAIPEKVVSARWVPRMSASKTAGCREGSSPPGMTTGRRGRWRGLCGRTRECADGSSSVEMRKGRGLIIYVLSWLFCPGDGARVRFRLVVMRMVRLLQFKLGR